jgi:hypothetical protein
MLTVLDISEVGQYIHPCEDDLVCKCTNEKIPHFNAPVFLENKQQIGKVDEIFGPIRDFVSLCYQNVNMEFGLMLTLGEDHQGIKQVEAGALVPLWLPETMTFLRVFYFHLYSYGYCKP